MRGTIRIGLAAATLAMWVSALPAAASEVGEPIASLTAATPLSAGSGWIVWSVPVGGRWALEAYHAGALQRLPTASRAQPFDVAVGTDSGGHAVATFSRCQRAPRTAAPNGEAPGAVIVPGSGAGCRIHVLALATARETAVPIPAPRGASDTSPSMWHGTVTFARHAPGHGNVWQVMRWSRRRPRRLVTIDHGAIPSYCGAEPCSARPARGEVQALSSDGSIVTFLWSVEAPGVAGEGAWEERIDDLSTGASTLADAGYGHEACTAPVAPTGLEYVWPEAPMAIGSGALFGELDAVGFCFHSFASLLTSHAAGAPRSLSWPLQAPVLALAYESSTLYALVPHLPAPSGADVPPCSVVQPCELRALPEPALTLQARAPSPPFLRPGQ
jgi:hypothetical protein